MVNGIPATKVHLDGTRKEKIGSTKKLEVWKRLLLAQEEATNKKHKNWKEEKEEEEEEEEEECVVWKSGGNFLSAG